jgi:hypothetical protein
MGEYLLSPEAIVLRNLMLYPPVEGSRESHQAWKQNVCLMLGHVTIEKIPLIEELVKPGFVSVKLRNGSVSYAKALPSERKC